MKRLCRFLTVAWLLILSAHTSSFAAESVVLPVEITIEEALRVLREESPRWAAEQAQLGLAQAEVIQAGLIANPSVTYSVLQLAQGANTGAATSHQLTVEQPLLMFGQRGKRILAAQASVTSVSASVAARLAERSRELHHTFVELLGVQERLLLLQEGRQEIQRGEAIVRGRAAAGDRSQYDVLRIELEARALDAEIATLEADRLDAAGRLGQLLGRPGWQPRARGDLTPSATAQSIGPLWVHAERNHPAIAAARHQVAAIHALLAQAERDRMPEVTLQVGLLATQAENSLSVLGGISLPLPLWNRQQGAIARAQASRTIAQQELRAVVSETQAALERTTLVSSTRHSAAARLAGEVFARLPELRRMAEDSYRQGKSGIVDLLDSFRSLKTLRLEYVDQIIAAEHAEVDLLYAAGVALVSKS